MAMIEFDIRDETEYTDMTDPKNPIAKIAVTFQPLDGRLYKIDIDKKIYTKEERNRRIRDFIKKLPPAVTERVRMPA